MREHSVAEERADGATCARTHAHPGRVTTFGAPTDTIKWEGHVRSMAKKKHERQEAAFDFLQKVGPNGEFTLAQLSDATGWTQSTAKTHIGKHYGDWVVLSGTKYRVLPEFRRITKEQFLRHCSQVRRVYTDYTVSDYGALCIFEFLLPMSRETQLRTTLDGLFYADALSQRFDELDPTRVEGMLSRNRKESDKDYRARLLEQVSDWFGGYSISLVSGRFRAASLRTRTEAVKHQLATGRPYLIDETTAAVRFIVPLPASKRNPSQPNLDFSQSRKAIESEAIRVRETFFALFVEAVIRIVNAEDVIWLLEESPLGRLLHTWEYDAPKS